ncbi:hypothetical protein H8D57_02590 [bacterium]|nr:hypothetical protein [bacterium]
MNKLIHYRITPSSFCSKSGLKSKTACYDEYHFEFTRLTIEPSSQQFLSLDINPVEFEKVASDASLNV